MKLYRARSKETKNFITFDGEVLFSSNPELFAVLLKSDVSKGPGINVEDLEIVESEWEKVYEY